MHGGFERLGPAFATALMIVTMTATVGCQNLKTREQIQNGRTQVGGDPEAPSVQQPPPLPQTGKTVPAQPQPPSYTQTVPAQPPPNPNPPTPEPPILSKEPPRVGVILGPGGMRSYAHIGVLKEMQRARIPVRGIVGLEWGAVMAALFSIQGQANEVEWKAFKLREDDIPQSGGLLKRGLQPGRVSDLGNFLSTVFAGQTIEKSRIGFACPAYNVRTEKFGWFSKGGLKEVVSRCAAYPPLYVDTDGWLAAPFAIEDSAQYLRSKGANLIIYVNVLAGGEMLEDALASERYGDFILWAELRRHGARARIPGVNIVINVATGANGITDYSGRRQMMEAGSKASQDVVNKLVSQYGF